jgi:hypothetical protein
MPIFDGIAPRNGPERRNDTQLYDYGEGAILYLCSSFSAVARQKEGIERAMRLS